MFLAKMGLKKPMQHLVMLLAAGALVAAPAQAQISNVDPNEAIDADLGSPPASPDTRTDTAPTAQGETVMQDGVPTETAPADSSATSGPGPGSGPGLVRHPTPLRSSPRR